MAIEREAAGQKPGRRAGGRGQERDVACQCGPTTQLHQPFCKANRVVLQDGDAALAQRQTQLLLGGLASNGQQRRCATNQCDSRVGQAHTYRAGQFNGCCSASHHCYPQCALCAQGDHARPQGRKSFGWPHKKRVGAGTGHAAFGGLPVHHDTGIDAEPVILQQTAVVQAQALVSGSGTFIDGFEDQIIGHKPGETFDVNVTFPDGYSDSTDASGNAVKLSGQKAVFTVVLNYISESVLPELTDSWVASTFGTSNNIYTVEALRAYYQDQLYTSNLNTAVMDDLLENSTFKSIPQQVMDYQVNQCLNYYSTLAGYYGYDLDGLVQNLLGYESTDDMLAHLESSLENYSKEALLYQAVAESLDITPTQEQLDAYSDYKDTYGQNYCTMVALMDAVTSTLTSGAVVS